MDIEQLIDEVAKDTKIDRDIVKVVCRHVFEQTSETMKGDSIQDILFNGLFKFKLKRRFIENKDKYTSR